MKLTCKITLSVVSLFCCIGIMAQSEVNTNVTNSEMQNYADSVQREKILRQAHTIDVSTMPSLGTVETQPSASGTPPLKMTYKFSMPKVQYALFQWDGGVLLGSNGQYYTNLWGYYANANIQMLQNIGDRWSLTGGVELQKYGSTYNTFSMNASASYRFGNNIYGTGFGSFESPSFLSSSHLGMSYQYGGYLTFETNNHKWGIDVGVRRGFNAWTGKHYAVPIARPYYKIGDSKIGIDFGGLFQRNDDCPPIFVPRKR